MARTRTRKRKARSSVPAIAYVAPPPAPTFRNSWIYFVWLIATAIVAYYALLPVLVIAAVIAITIAWVQFAIRFPLTATFIAGFVGGLFGGHRRRRRW